LPFRDRSFGFVKCYHVIEHLDNPRMAIIEITRVCSGVAEISFPIGDGCKIPALLGLSTLNLKAVASSIRTRTWREHKWEINPAFVENLVLANGFDCTRTVEKVAPFMFPFVTQGRKGAFARFLLSFLSVHYGYRVVCHLR
jgi:2-polyprenyl-3-methyl-5-hydroxy-6-metoxy-1,4-benzoquinol methylase